MCSEREGYAQQSMYIGVCVCCENHFVDENRFSQWLFILGARARTQIAVEY